MESKIPGLKQIIEEQTEDGKTRFVFDIDDDRSDEFFAINNFIKEGKQ